MNPSPNSCDQDDPRVALAAERTLLAWIRTGLALMGFGFVVARFGVFLHELAMAERTPQPSTAGSSLWIGAALITLGVVVNVLAAVQHVRLIRRLQQGEPYRLRIWSFAIIVSLLLAVLGVVMTACLLMWRH